MKKYFVPILFAFAVGLSFTSCLNDNDDDYQNYFDQLDTYQEAVYEQYQTDSLLIVDYINTTDSIAVYDSTSGIFYHIIDQGTENGPNSYSTIKIKYKGMLLDGTIFDQTDDETSFYLRNLIVGWQVGLPLIGEGGKIILYLPSYYGYGTSEQSNIPANSVLVFEIELISFN